MNSSYIGGSPPGFALAVVGDLVASREMDRDERHAAQRRLGDALAEINAGLSDNLLCRANVTAGDGFEMLLGRPDGLIPALTWLSERLAPTRARLGLGRGAVYVLPEDPDRVHEADGPALHAARAALDRAKKEDRWASAKGFAHADDTLNALFAAIGLIRNGWTSRQTEIVHSLRSIETSAPVRSQKEVSRQLDVTQGTVSSSLKAAHFSVVQELEQDAQRLMARNWEHWKRVEDQCRLLGHALDDLPERLQAALAQHADPGGQKEDAQKRLLAAGARLRELAQHAVNGHVKSAAKNTVPGPDEWVPLLADAGCRLRALGHCAEDPALKASAVFLDRLTEEADWLRGEVDRLGA